jgi:hypothetical protein
MFGNTEFRIPIRNQEQRSSQSELPFTLWAKLPMERGWAELQGRRGRFPVPPVSGKHDCLYRRIS